MGYIKKYKRHTKGIKIIKVIYNIQNHKNYKNLWKYKILNDKINIDHDMGGWYWWLDADGKSMWGYPNLAAPVFLSVHWGF